MAGVPLKPIIGDIFKSIFNGKEYIISKLVQNMVVLESKNGMKQIITEVDNLALFYRKKEQIEV